MDPRSYARVRHNDHEPAPPKGGVTVTVEVDNTAELMEELLRKALAAKSPAWNSPNKPVETGWHGSAMLVSGL